MVTRDILYFTIDKLLDVVVNMKFPLQSQLSVGWYLFKVVMDNRYPSIQNYEITLCIIGTGIVFVARWGIPLLTMPLLDIVMINQIHLILRKSFKENSLSIFCQILMLCYCSSHYNLILVLHYIKVKLEGALLHQSAQVSKLD